MRQKHLLTKMLLLVAVMLTGAGTAWADTTYKLTQVTSVEAGGLYVFEQDGHVMNNTVSSSALQTTTNYSTTGLSGTESYVWTLEAATGGFYLKNVSLSSSQYLNNTSSTSVSFGSKNSIWTIAFTDGIALISNKSNSDRFLGYTSSTSYAYKAYATSNLSGSSYPHAITVYKLEEEGNLTNSDLALADAPVELSFDLFNNSSAQVVAFTTSSTGAVTVSESEYIDCVVNANTITVTPLKVTPSAQTITISQAADDTYKAGSATFTVTITDSTPFDGAIFDATKDKDSNSGSITKDNVTLACDYGILGNGTEYRLYKNSTTTISTTDGSKITKIEFTGTSSNPASGFGTQTGWKTSGDNGVWEGEAESVSFVASGAQVRATVIKVTVKPSTDPSISAENVNISYDATAGEIAYTLKNEVDGGTLTASVAAGDWLTLGSGTTSPILFTCSANTSSAARTATVTLTYTYGNNETVTKNVTISQAGNPNAVDNISDITEVGSSYKVKGTIVALNNRGFVIGDGTGYVYYYGGTTPTQSVGNIVSISGTTGTYGQIIQFTNTATVAEASTSNYTGTPAATVIKAVPDYTSGYHLSDYLQFDGTLTKSNSNYFITVGSDDIQISYPTTAQGTALTTLNGKTVRVKGYFSGINSNKYFTVMLESVEEIVIPTITVASIEVNATAAETDGTITVTYNNLTNYLSEVQFVASDGETSATYDWLDAEINASDDTKLDYTIGENTSTEARKAYMKVYAVGDEGEAYSEMITITQAAYEAPKVKYALFTGDLVEGDYVIFYESQTVGKAMKNTVSEKRLTYVEVAPEGDVIGTNNAAIVWHIAPSGSYWTIYSADANAYAASTCTKNQAQMLADGTNDKALWSVSVSDKGYEFVNKANTDEKVNSNLRNNGTYGFACYSTSTGGALSLYKMVSESISITAAGYATYCSTNALDFTNIEGLTAYKATVADKQVSFTEVNQVPAGEGVLLKGTDGTYTIPVLTHAKAIENDFEGVTEATEKEAGIFVLMNPVGGKGVGFYKTTQPFTVGANTAYLPALAGGNGTRTFIGLDEATAIEGVAAEKVNNGEVYNLQGQRVVKAQKGLYIMNGKKVLVK